MDLPSKYELALQSFSVKADKFVNDYANTITAKPAPKRIYHYTNDAGLRGILENKLLWLTDIFDLNDPSELRHGLNNASQTLFELTSDLTPECKFLAERFADFVRSGVRETADYFCCCFSSEADELGQWRAYADNGHGFALGFDAESLERDFGVPGDGLRSTFPVAYDDEKLSNIQREIIQSALEAVQLPDSGYLSEEWGRKYATLIATRLTSNAIYASTFFKHTAYKNESEYRFMSVFGIDNPPVTRKYRSRPYSLVKYIDYPWGQKSLASLKEIIIGPAADRTKATKLANNCLQAFGFSNSEVKIVQSTVPYRAT